MTPFLPQLQRSLLRRIAAEPICFVEFKPADWPLVVAMGQLGLVKWPVGEVVVSISEAGKKALDRYEQTEKAAA